MFKQYYGKFFDSNGEFIGNKKFKRTDEHFKYKNRRYNNKPQKASYYEVTAIPLILKKRYYFYNIEISDPILMNKQYKPIIEPELYNLMIETEQAKKLNDLSKKGLLTLLDPKIIIGILIGLGLLAYFLQGGSITP